MESLLKNIIEFNNKPAAGLSSSEIIKKGLNVYKSLPGFINAAYYYLEQEDFDFSFEYSTFLKEKETNEAFRELEKAEGITRILSTGNITHLELQKDNGEQSNHLIIPLIAPSGMLGLVLLLLENPIADKNIMDLCKMHSNYLAVFLENSQLRLESENLKEFTEQKIALKTKDIARSTRELKIILDSVQAGIIITDKFNGQVVDLNMAASRLIGTGKEKIIGTLRKNHFFFTEQSPQNNYSYLNQEGLLKTNDGILIPIIRTIKDIDLESMKYTIESFMDISDRKQMEDALHEARFELEQRVEERTQELLQANDKLQAEINDRKKAEEQLLKLYWAVEQSPISIMITDLNGNIEYVNSYFSKITGYKFKDAMNNSFRSINYAKNSEHLHKEIWKNLIKGIEWRGEFQNKRIDGSTFWVSSSFSPIRNTGGDITHYLSVQEDISQRKRVENELLAAKEKAEQSDKLKSSLLANMSHEFRTPLIGILGFSQILTDLVADGEQKEMVTEIQLSGKRLLNTLNSVLDISQLEASDISKDFVKTDLVPLIKSGAEEFTKSAELKNLKFISLIKKDKLISAIDNQLFMQALKNIIDNAVKYTDKGTVSVEADEKIIDDRRWILIRIKDTGIGISEKDKKIVFEAFRQASEGYTRNFEGCGLGLTISKKIFEMFGGYITLESGSSSGSVFTVWLPVCDSELSPAAEKNNSGSRTKVKLPRQEVIPNNKN